jgi:hypothetical protein
MIVRATDCAKKERSRELGGSTMTYAMLFLQAQRASIRIADAIECKRVPSNADLKLLGLKAQLFRRKAA